jgi:hypothetical protein
MKIDARRIGTRDTLFLNNILLTKKYTFQQKHANAQSPDLIIKAIIRTGSLGSCFVCVDIGSSEPLAIQNLPIPEITETRVLPMWLIPPQFSDNKRLTELAG